MIQLNTPYSIENGTDTVTFNEGKKESITGTYKNGTLTGTIEGNLLKATFHNTKVNVTGLIEITFHENGFDGKWKKGLEPGPMKGKWYGKLNTGNNDSSLNELKSFDFNEFVKNGVFAFEKKLKEVIDEAKELDEETQYSFMYDFFDQLDDFISNNSEYVYFGRIAERIVQKYSNEQDFAFYPEGNQEFKETYTYSLSSLRNTGLIKLVINEEKLDISKINNDDNEFNRFLNHLSSYFIYSLDTVVEEDDAEELAEFIYSVSADTYRDISDENNCIVDQILDVLKVYGFNINDYDGECEIYPNYYLRNAASSGYDYISFSETIISELYCP